MSSGLIPCIALFAVLFSIFAPAKLMVPLFYQQRFVSLPLYVRLGFILAAALRASLCLSFNVNKSTCFGIMDSSKAYST